MLEEIVTRILRLPGYGVITWEADDTARTLTLWVRQAGGEPAYICGGCGGITRRDIHSWRERRVRDLPWGTWHVWLVVDVHRVRCRRCGVRTERIPWLAGKARYTARFEAAVAQECEQAPVIRVAARWGLPPETVRQLDKRALRRWAAHRPRKPRRYLGVDEFFVGKGVQFLTVALRCLVTDILLPGMDGWQLIAAAIHEQPMLRLVAMTGADARGDRERAFALGVPVLQKPFGLVELRDALQEAPTSFLRP